MNILNNNIPKMTNSSYREYLVNNTNSLIENNKNVFCNYKKFIQRNGNNKYLFKSINDNNKPFGYEVSDLKINFIQKQTIKTNNTAPIISSDYFKILNN